MPPGLSGSADSLPFIKLPGASLASTNTVDFGSIVGTFLPLNVHRWDHPEKDKPFFNRSGYVRLGDLSLLATWGSAIYGEVEQRCEAQLIVPYAAGINTFTVNRQSYTFRTSCLFLPAASTRMQLDCSQCSGIIISFPPESLLPTAHSIAGPGHDLLALRAALGHAAILNRKHDPRRERLHRLLMETMAYVETCLTISGNINPMLCLDDLIRRLIVMLLVPDYLESARTDPLNSEPFVHQELVEWLLANLQDPISLSDMEKQSCYGRRSLQKAFRQHFGCGPMQWLRQQRLSKAKALLEEPGSHRSLAEVAQACGYLSQASFSRDFLARYGDRPSRIQRRFRDRSIMELLRKASSGKIR